MSIILEKIQNYINAANDPRTKRMLVSRFKMDQTIPIAKVVGLGPKPSDDEIIATIAELFDGALSNTSYGDISRDGKFDNFLIRNYINGSLTFEDISGEAGDTLASWRALSIRRLLRPEHQDFNRFSSLSVIQSILTKYQSELYKIRDEEKIKKMKRDAKSVVLIDDERFFVAIPLNFGACYIFNNADGIQARFCTGSSSGESWFRRYSPEAMLIMVFDKDNLNDRFGKWQIHSSTHQIKDALQQTNSDHVFGELFPGLMNRIVNAINSKEGEIAEQSKIIPNLPRGYIVSNEVSKLKNTFPRAFTKELGVSDEILDEIEEQLLENISRSLRTRLSGESNER